MIDKTKILKWDKDYLYIITDKTPKTKKKMSGHSFVALAGFDNFNKRGDAVLNLLGIKKDTIDPKYLYRGEEAERLVRQIYEKKLNKKIVWYNEQAKKDNHYDFFPSYVQCGGIPDILLPEEQIIIEVKSKSMKDYNYIKSNGAPLNELYQGLYYSYLSMYGKTIMFYVFFDEESEKEIFANNPITNYSNLKFLSQEYVVKRDDIELLVKSSLKYYNECVREQKIPLCDISKNVLLEIGVGGDFSDDIL